MKMDELRKVLLVGVGQRLDGIYYVGFITFYENGQVKEGTLTQNTIINGIPFFKNELIRFDDRGNVTNQIERTLTLSDNTLIKGILFKDVISFYPNGQVKEATLGRRKYHCRCSLRFLCKQCPP